MAYLCLVSPYPVANIITRVLVWPYEQWFLRTRAVGNVEGIALVDYPRNTPFFREIFATALQILQQRDPRQHRRVLRYGRSIINFPIGYSGAGYIQHLKAYTTSLQPLPDAAVRKEAILQASMLVHEATHGLLYARKIPYHPDTRERIEQLCSTEEHRFLSRVLTPESLGKVKTVRRYHPELYQRRWSLSLWRRIGEGMRYTKEENERRKQREIAPTRPNQATQRTASRSDV
jgi:hypothetical protein